VDFIDVYMVRGGKEHHWPTFNVADIAIVPDAQGRPTTPRLLPADLGCAGQRPERMGAVVALPPLRQS
jgi:hypothetical protein